jgi:hypothetical protein
MRRDVLQLRAFYASARGRAAREMLTRKIVEAWGDAAGLDVLGLGYATPLLNPLCGRARRVVAAMPAAQGVEVWPTGSANLALLSDEFSVSMRTRKVKAPPPCLARSVGCWLPPAA